MRAYEWTPAHTDNGLEDSWTEHELTPVRGTLDWFTDEAGDFFRDMHDGRFFDDKEVMLTATPAHY